MPNIIKKFQNTIFSQKLFERGDKILLAVSGGPDSVTMLDIFAKLKNKYDLELAIAHVNYCLRGYASDSDEELVCKLAKKYSLRFFVSHPNFKNTSEDVLRNIRYSFFEKIRRQNNFDHISIAHNMDDQVETFFMRVIRGAGLQGLSAMKYKNEKIIRPLLNLNRKEILDYLKKNKLQYRIDKSNLESKYLRNKIRNKLIPFLEKKFNPQIKKTVFSSIENIAEDYSFINLETLKISSDKNTLSVKKLSHLHPAIKKRSLLVAISKIKPDMKNVDSSHINEILKITDSKKNKRQIMKFNNLKVERRGDKLTIDLIKK
ncbi:MAG TPA: tRNA lysidine(34) synthetase TilS [Patescibacteria group bacterium]|nr:tRNA lysidine(34) synthetase TilS [Patescibacteria group bacterium]